MKHRNKVCRDPFLFFEKIQCQTGDLFDYFVVCTCIVLGE